MRNAVGVDEAGCVTNVLNKEVGVGVLAGAGVVVVSTGAKILTGDISAKGVSVTGLHPMGVGVSYCPQSDEEFPPQAERAKVVRIRNVITRFTAGIIPLTSRFPLTRRLALM